MKKFHSIIQEMGLSDWNSFQLQVLFTVANRLDLLPQKLLKTSLFQKLFRKVVDRNKPIEKYNVDDVAEKITKFLTKNFVYLSNMRYNFTNTSEGNISNKSFKFIVENIPSDGVPYSKDIEFIKSIAKKYGLEELIKNIDMNQLIMGYKIEKEHDTNNELDVVKNSGDILKIAIAHLRENQKYYSILKTVNL